MKRENEAPRVRSEEVKKLFSVIVVVLMRNYKLYSICLTTGKPRYVVSVLLRQTRKQVFGFM